MQSCSETRCGFTLVEVLLAVLLVSVALLALEGGAAVLMRRLADEGRELLAARLVQARADRIAGVACAASAGADSANGVVTTWSAAPTGGVATVAQTTWYVGGVGTRSESYRTVVPCR